MKGSQELIAYFNKREEELGEKATKFNLFLEGYAEGYNDTKAIDEKEMFAEREKAFYNGYEVAKKELIEKACEWLETYMESLGYIDEWCRKGEDDFRKAMEE